MRNQAAQDEGRHTEGESSASVEQLIRDAHWILDRLGLKMSHTRVVRLCRSYALSPEVPFATFIAAQAERDSADLARLVAQGPPKARPVREWDKLAEQRGAWPVSSGGGA